MSEPTVLSIFTCPSKGMPMVSHDSIRAEAGRGLVGDRYCLGTGFYSGDVVWDADVTLIAQEAFDAVNEGHNANFEPQSLRRNIVTKNISVKGLIGRKFRIGSVLLEGTKEWPPCGYIAGLNGTQDVIRYFAHSAGVGASVLEDGEMRIGDVIEVIE